jgi:hypothetical protein
MISILRKVTQSLFFILLFFIIYKTASGFIYLFSKVKYQDAISLNNAKAGFSFKNKDALLLELKKEEHKSILNNIKLKDIKSSLDFLAQTYYLNRLLSPECVIIIKPSSYYFVFNYRSSYIKQRTSSCFYELKKMGYLNYGVLLTKTENGFIKEIQYYDKRTRNPYNGLLNAPVIKNKIYTFCYKNLVFASPDFKTIKEAANSACNLKRISGLKYSENKVYFFKIN